MVNTESYVDRSTRRSASRAAWKQSQCIASGQISAQSSYHGFSSNSLNRVASSLGHPQHSSVSISSGSVSSIASSHATSGPTGKRSISYIFHVANMSIDYGFFIKLNSKTIDVAYMNVDIIFFLKPHQSVASADSAVHALSPLPGTPSPGSSSTSTNSGSGSGKLWK